MTSADIALVVKTVSPVIRDFYQAQIDGLKKAFELELKTQQQMMAALELRVAAAEQRPMLAGPVGPQGEPGERGQTGEIGPQGIKGDIGERGQDGAVGPQGAPGAMGDRGADGVAGIQGAQGPQGLRGEKGETGIGVVDGLVTADGRLMLTFSNGLTKDVGVVRGADGAHGANGRDGMPGVPGRTGEAGQDGKNGIAGLNGKDGAPGQDGRDGKDGLGFDDFDITLDETKGFLAVWTNGKRRIEKALPLPFNAGLWQAGRTYPKSAYVEWKGSQFYALRQTNAQPDESGSQDWRLVAKRGRNGKDGKDGRDGL